MTWRVLEGDCRAVLPTLAGDSVQTCITSPPYWGLRDYGLGKDQIGLERTPEEYVARMVEVFREVRRVLRPDGTLWLNLGDCYATGAGKVGDHPGGGDRGAAWSGRQPRLDPHHRPLAWDGKPRPDRGERGRALRDKRHAGKNAAMVGLGPMTQPNRLPLPGLKPKDLVGIPWRVAFALQADGWWLRAEVIWSKPNAMPESALDRPTRAHEQLFLLTKSQTYFYDRVAIAEPARNWGRRDRSKWKRSVANATHLAGDGHRGGTRGDFEATGRNRRSVWTISTKPYAEAHFAAMPWDLAEPCILAATSGIGECSSCGAPHERLVEETFEPQQDVSTGRGVRGAQGQKSMDESNGWQGYPRGTTTARTVGWNPTCECGAEPRPQLVLDPFAGTGTTGMVARRHGRSFLGIELSPNYVAMAKERIQVDAPLLNRRTSP